MGFKPRPPHGLGKHYVLACLVKDTNAFVFWDRRSISWLNSSWILPMARQALNLGFSHLSLVASFQIRATFYISAELSAVSCVCGLWGHLTPTSYTIPDTSLAKQRRGAGSASYFHFVLFVCFLFLFLLLTNQVFYSHLFSTDDLKVLLWVTPLTISQF